MEFLFILHYLSFLSVSIKRCEKITKGVDRVVAHSTYYVTKQPLAPCDIISNAPVYREHDPTAVVRPTVVHLTWLWLRVKCVIMLIRCIFSPFCLALLTFCARGGGKGCRLPAVNRCRVFGVYFITSLTSEYLPIYNLDK